MKLRAFQFYACMQHLNKKTYGVKTMRSQRLSDHIYDLFKEAGTEIFEYRENPELEDYLKELFA